MTSLQTTLRLACLPALGVGLCLTISSTSAVSAPACASYSAWKADDDVRLNPSAMSTYFERTSGSGSLTLTQDIPIRAGKSRITVSLEADGNNDGFAVLLNDKGSGRELQKKTLRTKQTLVRFAHTAPKGAGASELTIQATSNTKGKTWGTISPVRVCQ